MDRKLTKKNNSRNLKGGSGKADYIYLSKNIFASVAFIIALA